MRKTIVLLILFVPFIAGSHPRRIVITVDICVYGGTSAGVIAAYTARQLHKRVLLVEPGYRLGGLSSGGLGFTDIGNKYVVSGLARNFYRRVGSYYGRFEQWIFEPKVAESIFQDYIKRSGCQVIYGNRLKKLQHKGAAISSIELENSTGSAGSVIVVAKQYIDCSYEGDLMAAAGVSYTTGREPNTQYNETVNGVQLKDKHQFPDGVDPYKEPGRPESGLLWGIDNGRLAEIGSGDKKIQAYNFRICLSNDPANRLPITRPVGYDSTRYELLLRYLAVQPAKDLGGILKMDLMPNHKTDINNNGPFSTDMIGMNYDYADGDYTTRARIIKQHEVYTKGLLYFIGHDMRMPEQLRKQMLQWGYPKDEYKNTGHWTPQLYIREARRMLGAYIMTQANCQAREVVDDGIGMAAYTMDSHNCQRLVVNGMVKNEGDVQQRDVQPYPVSYRSITPRASECTNLLVPVCLSASHMAYGSIRMEPVFMVLAQSAAVASCMAVDHKTSVQKVDVKTLQTTLKNNPLADNSTPEVLVDNDDPQTVVTGEWKKEATGGYGPSLLINTSKGAAVVRFTPVITKAGKYNVYFYCPKRRDASTVMQVHLFDGNKSIHKRINKNDLEVKGQTSGEWVLLGTTELPVGNNAYVEVSNEDADGAVVADAVLFVP
ncbi:MULTISPECIES: FAD-dependent oxidoreductase [Niastella]|uniref:FAD-dependent oxidoreductase n=1 Tax=Niastella soli TaxID=2821487 RepID=A0ABS3YVW4_9BACT|nr:FAD-dependent oxidoreductase [Niastella soli]MBO9202071.1 FAD-dependent oxidoreductase [Niastella soli]